MSTDFSGKNKSIKANDLYLMLSDCIAGLLNTDRGKIYNAYKKAGKCDAVNSWGYFDRYAKHFNSNNYVGNKFDNIIILKESVDKSELYDVNSPIDSRKAVISGSVSEYQNLSACNDFKLTGFFPHLDKANRIESIDGVIGTIPCIEYGEYETFHALISYTDSCDCNFAEPVPYYPLTINNDSASIMLKDTLDDEYYNISASYLWTISSNNESIALSDAITIDPTTVSKTRPYIKIATLSSAVSAEDIIRSIDISLSYEEF